MTKRSSKKELLGQPVAVAPENLYASFPEAMRKVALELHHNPEKARLFFIEAGIFRPEGGLTAEYQPS
jgi:hypothetical protein